MAGFIFKKERWLGAAPGSTVQERAKYILKTFANLLLETNPSGEVDEGWTLDPRNATVDDFYEPVTDRAYTLFLISKSGAKLMLGYSLVGVKFSKPFSYANNLYMDGLFFSMIPAGSSSVFGTTYGQDDFIPLDATWPMAFRMSTFSSSPALTSSASVAYSSSASATYYARVLTDGDTILFSFGRDSYISKMIMIGPIIKTLAHPTMDTLPTKNMLVWRLTDGTPTDYPTTSEVSTDFMYTGSSDNSIRVTVGNPPSRAAQAKCDFFRADGEHITNSTINTFFDGSVGLTNTTVANATITGFYRWVALYIGVATPDPTSNYVVRGDGFKGYLDTDFIRYTQVTGRLDDGNFYGIGGNLAFGWDPSNEDW